MRLALNSIRPRIPYHLTLSQRGKAEKQEDNSQAVGPTSNCVGSAYLEARKVRDNPEALGALEGPKNTRTRRHKQEGDQRGMGPKGL